MVANPLTGLFQSDQLARGLLAFLVSLIGAVVVVGGTYYSWALPVAFMAAAPILVCIILRPRWGVVLLVFLLCFIEEFQGGISTDMVARSARTAFYAKTLGVPTLYMPDVLIGGLLVLYALRELLWRNGLNLKLDRIGVAFLLVSGTVFLSLIFSFTLPDPFGPARLDLSLLGSIDLPDKVARLIAILQIKIFLTLIPAYLLGLTYFRTERDIDHMLTAFVAAMAGTILLASFRLVRDPSLVTSMVAVIYDTASVWLMAMMVFYSVGMWSLGHYRSTRITLQGIFCLLLMLFILLSFRRTLWGAIALATLFFPFVLPRKGYARLLLLLVLGGIVATAVLAGTSPGRSILASIIGRLSETNFNEASTLYRFALLVWVVERASDLPIFGYGLMPLWNEQIRLRFFVTHMENVHSLYFWILLRFGPFGLAISSFSLGLVLFRMKAVYHQLNLDRNKMLVTVVFLGIIMVLFSGVFNPIYGRVRFLVPLGFALALVTRLPDIENQSKDARSHEAITTT